MSKFSPYPPLPELQVGDVLLYSPAWYHPVGLIIAVKTWTALSHAESYAGEGKSYGARLQGVNEYPTRIDKYLRFVRRPIMPPGTLFDADGAYWAIHKLLGRPYDVTAFSKFFAPWNNSRSASRICSVLCTYHLRGGGCQPFNYQLEECDISPAQLWQTPMLETIWERKKR